VPQTGRLTNLRQLKVDTTWWTRYRNANQNPDFGGKFENAVPDLANAPHPAIPQTDAEAALNSDGTIPNHLQAIANTADSTLDLSSREALAFTRRWLRK